MHSKVRSPIRTAAIWAAPSRAAIRHRSRISAATSPELDHTREQDRLLRRARALSGHHDHATATLSRPLVLLIRAPLQPAPNRALHRGDEVSVHLDEPLARPSARDL